MPNSLTYELLALDPTESTRCQTAPALLHRLCGCSDLWKSPQLREDVFQIEDGSTILHVGFVQRPRQGDAETLDVSLGRVFIVTLKGEYEAIEPMRQPLTAYLHDEKFDHLYVLRDDISRRIACQLYPHLYRIENQLRGYLIKFMSTKVGPKWWEVTVSGDTSDKVKMRRKNERVFSKYVEASAYLIDFDELGKIIYEQSTGNVTKEDILKRITSLPETPEAIKQLKQNLQTNYQKLFKESFADKEFREKWREFEYLRNKIAHGNLFTAYDLQRGEELAGAITEMIGDADQKTEDLVLTQKEREAIQESAVERSHMPGVISEEEFLSKLESFERRFHPKGGFVGLALFLRYLTGLGFNYLASKDLVGQLQDEKKVEVYSVSNPEGEFDTSAIRRNVQGPSSQTVEAAP